MEKILVFKNEQFGQVRTICKDGEPWFVGSEIAKVLGYTNSPKAIRDHVADEDKLTERIVLSGQSRDAVIINESGLYSLILSSKLPQAREFKRWVTAEVLPQIRKTGGYIPVAAEDDDEMVLCKALSIMKRTIEQKDELIAQHTALIKAQQPKVMFADAVVAAKDSILVRDLAKLITKNGINIGAGRLFYWLRLKGYLFKNEVKPIQKWVEKGLFETTIQVIDAGGRKFERLVTRVTGKGQQYFVNGFVSGRFSAVNGKF